MINRLYEGITYIWKFLIGSWLSRFRNENRSIMLANGAERLHLTLYADLSVLLLFSNNSNYNLCSENNKFCGVFNCIFVSLWMMRRSTECFYIALHLRACCSCRTYFRHWKSEPLDRRERRKTGLQCNF